jgi:two-component system chemotaxis sensor kinase CheA
MYSVDHFKQSFREEAREILVELEAALLELNENRDDAELVGRAFRALHTIKGSGAMFGFDDLAAFTHDLETAYDEVRNGRLSVTAELIDLTLAALDRIKAMLEEGGADPAAEQAACAKILLQVRGLTASADGSAELARVPAPPPVDTAAARGWRIRFAPGPDLMASGANPLLLLRELRLLGALEARASMASIPPLAALEPERCYVAWEMTLWTAASPEAIRDVFIFVEDLCELALEPAPEMRAPDASALPTGSQADQVALGLREPRGTAGRRDYDKADTASSIRVPAAKLDQFVDLVGELVTVQARLSEIAARLGDTDVSAVSEQIGGLTAALRETSMNIRMLPVRATFERFRRLVHDLARDLNKDVELAIEGAETELDKTVIDRLGDPLMHLIRNSMDHGIEPAEARRAAGKRPTATIQLAARHSGASVLISVKDDGAGINAEAVLGRAVERGLVAAGAHLSEAETFALIFEPGFSTARQITDVSGRGVGMDVVRRCVDSLRGTIDVASAPGKGTGVTLRLPLTLAIIDGLLVAVGPSFFVLPLANTLECIELSRQDIAGSNGKHVAYVRGEAVPYIRLREQFAIRGEDLEIEQIMIVETASGRYGFVVDRVLGDCQTVIKNLGRVYRHVQEISGATILGDGTVALILDPERLVQDALRAASQGRPRAAGRRAEAEGRNGGRHQTPQASPPQRGSAAALAVHA